MTVNIEDAGFEIRDQIMWLYGSGFPKSHNIGKSVDKIRGNEREWISESPYKASDEAEMRSAGASQVGRTGHADITKGTSEWEGWGSSLKPANEPICVARKPLSEKTVAQNVLKWGTGGINIDGCRVAFDMEDKNPATNPLYRHQNADKYKQVTDGGQRVGENVSFTNSMNPPSTEGRFPANIILDEEAGMALDEQSGILQSGKMFAGQKTKGYDGPCMGKFPASETVTDTYGDKGGASRFFYCPKVSKKERNAGCDEATKNTHPTVKPISLMAYLCRLVTPPNGIVLDPFMGSGSTGCAAIKEGFRFCGMEMDEDYFEIATKRINHYGKEEGTKV
jgi:site-specific DNA-methyltransferase (adenine-specific)